MAYACVAIVTSVTFYTQSIIYLFFETIKIDEVYINNTIPWSQCAYKIKVSMTRLKLQYTL